MGGYGEAVGLLSCEGVSQKRGLGVHSEVWGRGEDGLAVLHTVDRVGLLGGLEVGVGCTAAHWAIRQWGTLQHI